MHTTIIVIIYALLWAILRCISTCTPSYPTMNNMTILNKLSNLAWEDQLLVDCDGGKIRDGDLVNFIQQFVEFHHKERIVMFNHGLCNGMFELLHYVINRLLYFSDLARVGLCSCINYCDKYQ